ncbi:MAG: hypothetical protein ACRCWM_00330 [Sarcina sp.]
MEIFYPEDFNALFGRGNDEELPEKIEEKTVDTDLPEEEVECSLEKKIDLVPNEDLSRSCPCENETENEDGNISENRKPMQLPPKATPPKTADYVINQKKIGNANYPKYAVSAQALSICLNKLTYIWQNDNKEYWSYIFYIDHVSFVGWRWNEYIKDWVYFGVDISKVEAFTCKR